MDTSHVHNYVSRQL